MNLDIGLAGLSSVDQSPELTSPVPPCSERMVGCLCFVSFIKCATDLHVVLGASEVLRSNTLAKIDPAFRCVHGTPLLLPAIRCVLWNSRKKFGRKDVTSTSAAFPSSWSIKAASWSAESPD